MNHLIRTHRLVFVIALLAMIGCRPAETPEHVGTESNQAPTVSIQPTKYRANSPEQVLRSVFDRYQRAASYHDRAIARLEVTGNGDRETKSAPLHIWYHKDQLFLEAYDVRVFADRQGMMAWIADPTTDHFDGQVLRTGADGGRPKLESLLADPILRQQIAAGLAGPPPQLAWLFSDDPMNDLFRREHRFTMDRGGMIDDRPCQIIRVDAGRETYRFWIDETTSLVRRIELPTMMGPPVAGQPPTRMTVTIELIGATFRKPSDRPEVDPLPPTSRYVKRFVPLPPIQPSSDLGERPRQFRATTQRGRIKISDAGSERPATAILRCADDQTSLAALGALADWHAKIPDSMLTKLRLVIVAPPEIAGFLPQQVSLPVIEDRTDTISDALNLLPGQLVVQNRSGVLVWKQSDFSPSGLVTLGAIIADVIDGVDVPTRLRQQWQAQRDAYETALQQVSWSPSPGDRGADRGVR